MKSIDRRKGPTVVAHYASKVLTSQPVRAVATSLEILAASVKYFLVDRRKN